MLAAIQLRLDAYCFPYIQQAREELEKELGAFDDRSSQDKELGSFFRNLPNTNFKYKLQFLKLRYMAMDLGRIQQIRSNIESERQTLELKRGLGQ